MKILVVEGGEGQLLRLEKSLSDAGHEVTTAWSQSRTCPVLGLHTDGKRANQELWLLFNSGSSLLDSVSNG